MRLLAACLALMTASTAVDARDVVGRAQVNDRPVLLFSDGSWSFETTPLSTDCQVIDETVEICDIKSAWRSTTGPTYGYDAIFRYQSNNILQAAISSQPYGRNVGNSFEGVLSLFVKGGAETDGIPESDVQILGLSDSEMGGQPAKHFVLAFPQNGLWQVNAYTVVIEEDVSIYALTWSPGTTYTDTMQMAHDAFVETITLSVGKTDQ